MIKHTLFIFGIILVSCSSNKDEAFCDCLEATETLNTYSQKFMSETPEPAERQKLLDLQVKKDSSCVAFETLDGETARKKKEACEQD